MSDVHCVPTTCMTCKTRMTRVIPGWCLDGSQNSKPDILHVVAIRPVHCVSLLKTH